MDPGVSVMCDVQNTLVCTAVRTWGTEEQKEKFLPRLATSACAPRRASRSLPGADDACIPPHRHPGLVLLVRGALGLRRVRSQGLGQAQG